MNYADFAFVWQLPFIAVLCSNSPADDIIELAHAVKVPKEILEKPKNVARYKYCVFSNANELMKSPYEFFTGSLTSTSMGHIIDRSLRRESLQTIQRGSTSK